MLKGREISPKKSLWGHQSDRTRKIATKIAKKKKIMTINTRKIAVKKRTMMIKNSILYNILVNRASANENPLRIKFQNWCPGGVEWWLNEGTSKRGKDVCL